MNITVDGPYPVLVDRKTPLIQLAAWAGFTSLEQDKLTILKAIGREPLGSVSDTRLFFLRVDCRISSEKVLCEMSDRFLVPASLTELLSLVIMGGNQIRPFRELFPIITLGTKWSENDRDPVVTGFVTGGERWEIIMFPTFSGEWHSGSHFLAREQ